MLLKENTCKIDEMIDYEFVNAFRHRRAFSIAMVGVPLQWNDGMDFIGTSFRSSDLMIMNDSGTYMVIVMQETAYTEAKTAINRCLSSSQGWMDLRFSLASYPHDGCDPMALLAAAERRLESAICAESGTLVAAG